MDAWARIPSPFREALASGRAREAVDAPADGPGEHFGRGVVCAVLGRWTEAHEALRLARDHDTEAAEIESILVGVAARSPLESGLDRVEALGASLATARARARWSLAIGLLAGRSGWISRAVDALRDAEHGIDALGDARGRAGVLDATGALLLATGSLEASAGCHARASALRAAAGGGDGTAANLLHHARVAMRGGRWDDALETLATAREEALREGNRSVGADALLERGRTLLAAESHGEAEDALRAAIDEAAACGDRGVAAAAEAERARVAASLLRRRRALPGASTRARQALRRARDLLGVADGAAEARVSVAEAEVDLAEGSDGDGVVRAVRALGSAADAFARLRLLDDEVATLVALAGAAAAAARLDPPAGHGGLVRRSLWRALDLIRLNGLSRHSAAIETAVVHHAAHFGPRPERRPLLDPGASPPAGTTPYVRLAPVGGGGFAQVFRAFDPIRARVVALKVMRLEGVADPSTRAAIEQTARDEWAAASDKHHPGIATVLGLGTDPEGRPYVVQEWVEGPTLEAVMAADPRPPADRVMRLVADVAGALAALDAYGIAHRDVKPSNVLLRGEPPRAVLVDFGLATGVFRPLALDRRALVGGTPPYAAPEQMDGGGSRADATHVRKADAYALGVIAYEWLDGPPLLDRSDRPLEDRLRNARRRLAVPLRKRRPDLPVPVCSLVDSMVSARPDRRPDAVDVAETAALLSRGGGSARGGGTT